MPDEVSGKGRVITSIGCNSNAFWQESGKARVHNPQPDLKAARALNPAAPPFPLDPANTKT